MSQPYVLSRISRRNISNLNATKRCSDLGSCLKAEGHSNKESNEVTYVQEPKLDKTITLIVKNDTVRELSDLSASTCKRRRSSNSSPERKILNAQTKENSEKVPTNKRGSRSMVNNQNLRMFVLSKLDQYRSKESKYNGIIIILADVEFLQYCYMLIKGKPGNMSAGVTKETLYGITYE